MAKDAARRRRCRAAAAWSPPSRRSRRRSRGKGEETRRRNPSPPKPPAAIDASNNIVSDDPAPNDAVNVDTKTIDFYDMSDTLTPYVEAWVVAENARGRAVTIARPEERGARSRRGRNAEATRRRSSKTATASSSSSTRPWSRSGRVPPRITSSSTRRTSTRPFAVHRTERGGEATYHGPGQLVIYPVFNLREHQTDLHWYMRSLEEVAIKAMRELGVENPGRVEGLTGAWANVPPSGAQEKEAASTPLAGEAAQGGRHRRPRASVGHVPRHGVQRGARI